jgi:hypothetical protein
MTRIVTSTYRPKRAPRKKAQAAAIGLHPNGGKKSAIVTAKKPGLRKAAAWVDDGQSDSELRAWLERAKWGHGPSR